MQSINVIIENVLILRLNVLCLVSIKQEDEEEVAVHYSGNPGYVDGLPLVSGTRLAEYPLSENSATFKPGPYIYIFWHVNDSHLPNVLVSTKSACFCYGCYSGSVSEFRIFL